MARWLGWIFTCEHPDCPREFASVSDDIEVAYIQLATNGWTPTQNLRTGRKKHFCPDHTNQAKP